MYFPKICLDFFSSSSNIGHELKKAKVAEDTRAARETSYITGNERTRMATKIGCPIPAQWMTGHRAT